jgi:hypothetical protein
MSELRSPVTTHEGAQAPGHTLIPHNRSRVGGDREPVRGGALRWEPQASRRGGRSFR